MVEKLSLSFPKLFWIENWLNIKKVMGRNVYMSFVSTVSTYIALNALHALILCLDSVNIHSIQNAQCISCFDPLYQVSRHETEVTVPFYVHTDKVTMSGFFII